VLVHLRHRHYLEATKFPGWIWNGDDHVIKGKNGILGSLPKIEWLGMGIINSTSKDASLSTMKTHNFSNMLMYLPCHNEVQGPKHFSIKVTEII
jgi:hypothetical protein